MKKKKSKPILNILAVSTVIMLAICGSTMEEQEGESNDFLYSYVTETEATENEISKVASEDSAYSSAGVRGSDDADEAQEKEKPEEAAEEDTSEKQKGVLLGFGLRQNLSDEIHTGVPVALDDTDGSVLNMLKGGKRVFAYEGTYKCLTLDYIIPVLEEDSKESDKADFSRNGLTLPETEIENILDHSEEDPVDETPVYVCVVTASESTVEQENTETAEEKKPEFIKEYTDIVDSELSFMCQFGILTLVEPKKTINTILNTDLICDSIENITEKSYYGTS